MSYGYPYGQQPPQGGGYPPQQPQGYGGYPPQGGGYPPQGGYPPAATGYPPAGGAGYPPAPGGGGYPPAPGGGYPPAPGGYPQPGAPGAYPPTGQAGLGFEGVASHGPPQPSAQSYGQQPGGYYGGAPGGYPPAAPTAPGGYPPAGHPGGAYQQPYGAPPPASYQAPGYGAPPQHFTGTDTLYFDGPYYQAQPYGHHSNIAKVTGGMATMAIVTHGTVKKHSPFNPEEDAKILRKAMKGLGTDEKSIINVIGYRTNVQRQEILMTYKQAFGKDLIKDFKSELSGNLESLVKAMFMKPRQYDVYCLDRAMRGIGTNEAALIEILASRTNAEIMEIRELYKKDRKDLEKELTSEASGHFRRLLVSLSNAKRDESTTVDQAKARADANSLYQAGEKKWGTDEATFNMIMCSRSHPQLRATFAEYKKIANRDITQSIKGEFSGDIEDGLKAIIQVANYPPGYFAERLQKAMSGAGTDDHTLIRVVVSRSEIDMVEIKQEFQKTYGQSLAKFIADDTSGDYKTLLLALVGK